MKILDKFELLLASVLRTETYYLLVRLIFVIIIDPLSLLSTVPTVPKVYHSQPNKSQKLHHNRAAQYSEFMPRLFHQRA